MKKRFALFFAIVFFITNLQGFQVNATTTALQNSEYIDSQGIKYSLNTDGTAILETATDKNITGSIDIPDNITYNSNNYKVTKISYEAFSGCVNLQIIKIPKDVEEIESAEYSFSACKSLIEIDVDINNIKYQSIDGILYSKGLDNLLVCPLNKIGKITIPQNTNNIAGNINDCKSITKIDVDSANQSYESDGEILYSKGKSQLMYCVNSKSGTLQISKEVNYISGVVLDSLSQIDSILVDGQNENYSSIGGLLYNKDGTSLEFCPNKIAGTIELSERVTELGYNVFNNCPNIESINVDPKNTNYSSKDGILYNKDQTSALFCSPKISGSVIFADNLTKLEYNFFDNCPNIESIKFLAATSEISNSALKNLKNLKAINVDLKNTNYSSKDGILYNKDQTLALFCPPKISGSVIFADNLIKLDYNFFDDCPNIESITFPAATSDISNYDFKNLKNLNTINVDSNNKKFASVDGILYDLQYKQLIKFPNSKSAVDTLKLPEWVKYISSGAIPDGKVKEFIISDIFTDRSFADENKNCNFILDSVLSKFEVENEDSLIASNKVVIDAAVDKNGTGSTKKGTLTVIDPNGHEYSLEKWYEGDVLENKYIFIPIIPGNYKLSFQLDNGTGNTKEITKEITVKENQSKVVDKVSVSVNSPQDINAEIKIGIEASDRFNFRFVVEKNGNFQTVKDFSKDKSFVWTPKEEGVYDIYADIMDPYGKIQRQAIINNYNIGSAQKDPLYLYKEQEERDIYDAVFKNKSSRIYISNYIKDSKTNKTEWFEYFQSLINEVCENNNYQGGLRIKNIVYASDETYFNLQNISEYNNTELNNVVKNFMENYIHDNYTDLQKELAVVHYLVDNCEYQYDEKDLERYSLYGALVNKKAVCEGYAEACTFLLNSCGVDCYTITSTKLNHAWNIVKINGKFYQMDTTWIDTACNWTYFNFSKDDSKHLADDLSDKELQDKCTDSITGDFSGYSLLSGQYYRYDSILKCFYSEDDYSDYKKWIAYEDNSPSIEKIYKNYLYYIDSSYKFKSLNLTTGEIKEIGKIDSTQYFNGITVDGDNLLITNYDYQTNKSVTVQTFAIDNSKVIKQNRYQITFKDYDGMVFGYQFANDKNYVTMPKPANREGYTFTGWDNDLANIDKDLEVTAVYLDNSKEDVPINTQSPTGTATKTTDSTTTGTKTADSTNIEFLALLFAFAVILIGKSNLLEPR